MTRPYSSLTTARWALASKSLVLKVARVAVLSINTTFLNMVEIGFESFTFKKLAAKIESTEASVYRYFENKHKLLIYLVSWYWNWVEYRLDMEITHPPAEQGGDGVTLVSF